MKKILVTALILLFCGLFVVIGFSHLQADNCIIPESYIASGSNSQGIPWPPPDDG